MQVIRNRVYRNPRETGVETPSSLALHHKTEPLVFLSAQRQASLGGKLRAHASKTRAQLLAAMRAEGMHGRAEGVREGKCT